MARKLQNGKAKKRLSGQRPMYMITIKLKDGIDSGDDFGALMKFSIHSSDLLRGFRDNQLKLNTRGEGCSFLYLELSRGTSLIGKNKLQL